MVGRQRQRRLLADAFDQAVEERVCHLFTVLGAAGVGKSRLVAEFLAGLEPSTQSAPRPLPVIRRRHHLLADRRGDPRGGRP